MAATLINAAPEVFERQHKARPQKGPDEPPDAGDVFEWIRDIQDPEHPYSLEQLNVVQEELISLDHSKRICTCAPAMLVLMRTAACTASVVAMLTYLPPRQRIDALICCCYQHCTALVQGAQMAACRVQFTPTVDHCSLATLIGLCIRTQLLRKLPPTYKIDITVRSLGCSIQRQHLQLSMLH